MTYLCIAIFVKDLAQAKRDIALAAEGGADLVELRIDAMTEPFRIDDAIVPLLLTCRPAWEGGHSQLSTDERIELLDASLTRSVAYVDVELKAVEQTPNVRPRIAKQLIVSAHDFAGRPDKLHNLVLQMNDGEGDVNKLVWTARTIRDNIEAFEIIQSRQKPTIAICMGEAGLMSRVLAKKFGGFLTFAALETGGGTAPGQVSLADMKRLYRWDAMNAKTRVYGVVGSPIMHSMSPAIHNAGFEAVGHDGVYLPMLVNPGYESFKAFMESFLEFAPLDLSGLSVTIPHKENALRYLIEKGAEVEELAKRIGTLNTIVIDRDAASRLRLRGFNTDYAAILDTITSALKITRDDLANKRVAVIGAGGTGRTAVAALAECGATVVVYNRTKERADALAAEFNGKRGQVVPARMEKLCDSCCHIFINTTSVGMHPNVDESPLGERLPEFTSDTLVFDTIYNPIETKLLRQAKQAGAKTVGGVEMFVRQAARQFEAWTGQRAPLELFRKVVESRLSRS
jgi:3-dehydroquinate dehydratase/shikimate dehydrogenase